MFHDIIIFVQFISGFLSSFLIFIVLICHDFHYLKEFPFLQYNWNFKSLWLKKFFASSSVLTKKAY